MSVSAISGKTKILKVTRNLPNDQFYNRVGIAGVH